MDARPSPDAKSGQELLLDQMDALAQAQTGVDDTVLFRAFLRRYFEMAALDTLKLRTPEELLHLALGHWSFARVRKSGAPLVRVLPPQAGDEARPGLAVVETCVEDQPFLVDSIVMAVRAAGASVDWTVHPVLHLRRDRAGKITAAEDVAKGPAESLIHLEFEPLANLAAYAALEQQVRTVLEDLRHVVDDYPQTLERVRALVEELKMVPPEGDAEEFAEAREFLTYLDQGHFTFLGRIESRATLGENGKYSFRTDPASGLGLLRAGSRWAAEDLIAPQAELDKYADSPRLVVVTKANLRATIHREGLMDAVSVKRYDAAGHLAGTVRFVGLFSSEVYIDRPRHIPLIRRKAEYVMQHSRLPESSHSGKNLRDILHGLPRDELFQAGEDELFQLCTGIRALRDRHQLRLFMRRDRYGRFYSFLVYLTRERYSRELRDKVGATLVEICGGQALDREVDFQRGGLTRMHYLVRTRPGTTIPLTAQEVETRLIAATRSWREQLRELLAREKLSPAKFADAFPLSYVEATTPQEAAADVAYLARLSPSTPVLPRLGVSTPEGALPQATSLKLYALHTPVTLSDVLPTLENFGLRVIRQEPAEITPKDSPSLWVQEFEIQHGGCELSADSQKKFFESGFLQVWRGEVENDGLNKLVLGAGLDARQVTLLRAICKYLIQTGLPFSQSYMETLLSEHADIARLLVALFETRFALKLAPERRQNEDMKIGQALDHALDHVASLDGDRVLRSFLAVIRATLRTNYFQNNAEGHSKHYVSFKLDPAKVPELPLPRPMFEVWVYAPEVEGIHLRGGKVARGGLRWSDRPEDFRTEVLGLVKAQMVKNTVIVPVGSKGGFVLKKAPPATDRDAYLKEGIACYQDYLRSLLDVTDNLAGTVVVPPPQVVRLDGDDPYLVVAADKGTATFSDYANAVSKEYGHWLGDAFASGGSVGYDHKAMGITARGAWEGVKRFFRETGVDIQSTDFTVVGVGDMSGDVFGNGMLLSRHIRLIAAFDHRHIFIDPNPDAAASFAERERLFKLPRSSWVDYDANLISAGGGIWARSEKTIPISPQARAVLGIAAERLTATELLSAILKAPVDLLYNGGIGTYVKASTQTHADVGDRANDALRINGGDLRCKVVGEGGNLGFTQSGRIEAASNGVRINTDAIDNSAGVDTSDHEVNIKILLGLAITDGEITEKQRNTVLAQMTDDVAALVLRDNYFQTQALSVTGRLGPRLLDQEARFIRFLEKAGRLNRAIEFLPTDDEIAERKARGLALTHPERAVLLAYSKMWLFDEIMASDLPEDPWIGTALARYFPGQLREKFGAYIPRHPLRREIVATHVLNSMVNRVGSTFVHRLSDMTGAKPAQVVRAYLATREVMGHVALWQLVEALDNKVPDAVQSEMLIEEGWLTASATTWFLRSRRLAEPMEAIFKRFTPAVDALREALAASSGASQMAAAWVAAGVPVTLAQRVADGAGLYAALDIAEVAEAVQRGVAEVGEVHQAVATRLGLARLRHQIDALPSESYWQSLAKAALGDDLSQLQRAIAQAVLKSGTASTGQMLAEWESLNASELERAQRLLAELGDAPSADLAMLSVALRELRNLA